MRIAMVAPLELRVPPLGYGGTELVVSLITEELIRRGHEVTLFASGDAVTSARLVSVVPAFLRGTGREKGVLNLLNLVSCLERSGRFDIIHNHNQSEGLAVANLTDTPMLTTFHSTVTDEQSLLLDRYTGWHNAISESAGSLLPRRDRFAGVVLNAIDVESYPFNGSRREPHLLFLSRMSPEKGAHLAIEVARRLGRRLILAGNVDDPDEEYFHRRIAPFLDGDMVRYVGEADHHQKRDVLSRAACLLAPITWDEPFGLFMIEAMACGTPVVAYRRGAASELVEHGKTGFVVDSVDEMAEAVQHVDQIDPRTCRQHVAERFDVPRMTDDYLALYERIVMSPTYRKVQGALPANAGRLPQASHLVEGPPGVTHVSD